MLACHNSSDCARSQVVICPGTGTCCQLHPATINSLPDDVLFCVLKNLHPSDRVCFALTCKRMAAATIAAPRLRPHQWRAFMDYAMNTNRHNVHFSYTILPRLMEGWVSQDQFKYCNWCCKIRTRDQKFWRRKLKAYKPLVWSTGLQIAGPHWSSMKVDEQHDHIIKNWCSHSFAWEAAHRAVYQSARDQNSGLEHRLSPCIHCPECVAKSICLRGLRRRPGKFERLAEITGKALKAAVVLMVLPPYCVGCVVHSGYRGVLRLGTVAMRKR